MTSIITLALICGTIVLCMRIRSNTKVRLAEVAANAAPIVLHADAATGEVLETAEADGGHLTDPDSDPNMGTNQTGRWVNDSPLVA